MAHNFSYNFRKWKQVPLKAQYANDRFCYAKPIFIVANRYNIEWGRPPVSYFDIPVLDQMIEMLKEDFQIVYNRPGSENIVDDNSEIKDLNEMDWLRQNHPEVVLMEDLYKKHSESVESFNHLQLMIYANCEHFASIHGGTAALASYFGGVNILFSKEGREHPLGEFHNLFPKLSGAKIEVVRNNRQLLEQLGKMLRQRKPSLKMKKTKQNDASSVSRIGKSVDF